MHQAAPVLSLFPPSSPSLSADEEVESDHAGDPSTVAAFGVPTRPRMGSAASTPEIAVAGAPWRRLGLAGFVAAAHLAGLATLAHLAPDRPTPAELAPIQVALIAAEPMPVPEPVATPPRPPEPIRPAPPPPTPAPPPPKPAVKKPGPKPAARRPAPVTESQTALSSAREAPPAPPQPAPPASAPAPVAAAPAPVTAARFDAAYLNNPHPGYPPLSRRLREQGQVTLRVLVAPDGLPAQVELRTSSGSERLDRAAREAVARWRFAPARRGDTAIESWVLVPIVFKLQGN